MFTNLIIFLSDILDNTLSVIKTMTLTDYIEIFILTWFMYILIRFVRETQAEQLLKGIFFIFIVLMLLQQLDFKVLGLLSETIINMGIIAIIVMFQPELRRVLEKMGRVKLVKTIAFNLENQPYNTSHRISGAIDQITQACEKLSRTATGALIVMERDTKLGEQISTGTILNALPSEELFRNIFHPNTPLHDGAVIVREGLILAAGCFLPKPQKEELISKDLGSRHRAAIGMSEVSDAIVIIVSEETGIISIAENGALRRGYDYQKLHGYLTQTIMPSAQDKPRREKRKKPYKSKVKEDDA